MNNYLSVDGLPIKQSPVYNYAKDNNIRYYDEMYANRDHRLYATLNDTLRIGGIHSSPASTGICVNKFTPYSFTNSKEYSSDYNSTDAPIIRYGEVLPKLPKMVISGSDVTANGVVINDPDRDPSVSPILWEIRRDWVEGDIVYERQYFTSVPKDQIKLYKDNGVTLTQNPGWDAE